MDNLAKIPYVVHELRMYKAYKRELMLKWALGISNIIWLAVVIWLLVR